MQRHGGSNRSVPKVQPKLSPKDPPDDAADAKSQQAGNDPDPSVKTDRP
jgi:hypothetical protein